MVILPLVGSQLKSVYLWGEKVYNLHDYMASMTTKKEFHSQSFEVLLFIEEALRDDISALEWTINDTIKNVEMTDMEKHKEINNLRRSLKQKVIAQNGIQKRLKTLNPNWKTLEEIEDAKR
tara:strand:- start:18 stop:380 length:363 start_codon:yes stop_codon:yes gene_type:complete